VKHTSKAIGSQKASNISTSMSSTNQGEEVETGLPLEQGNVEQVEKSEQVQVTADEKPKINVKNWLNLGAYIFNIVFTFGVGTNGWFGNGTNGELSQKYQVCLL
jgi:hypothetical protein